MTRRLLGTLLIGLTVVASVVLRLGLPVGWLYLVSRLTESSQPTMGAYVLVLVGIPATMIAVGKGLVAPDRTYGRVAGASAHPRPQAPRHRSQRGDRRPARAHSVLDVVTVCSGGPAVLSLGVWFPLFAGSSLPT